MSQLPGKLRSEHAHERWSNDWYVEPPDCVHALFDAVQFIGSIHDPCCGGGTIPKVAMQNGYLATGSDIQYRGFPVEKVQDFLTDYTLRDNIVSNPPYNMAEQMFSHACLYARRKVAFVVRISFLAGQRRRDKLFSLCRPSEVLILSKRPSMPPGGTDIPAKGGTTDYIWLIHERGYSGETILRWAA
jgi:hypothetical protein